MCENKKKKKHTPEDQAPPYFQCNNKMQMYNKFLKKYKKFKFLKIHQTYMLSSEVILD